MVLVNKAYDSPCMCVDFTNVNDACPKDCFLSPSIDQLVNTTANFSLMSFLDAYTSYHYIRMHPEDEEKTSFIIEEGTL